MPLTNYLFAFSVVGAIIFSLVSYPQQSYSQFIPIPPPGGNTQNPQDQVKGTGSSPPVIEFMTPSLKQGKNVFAVKVVGSSPIELVQIKVASDGKVIANKMELEGNNVYKMLLDAQGPSKVIVVRAFDTDGRFTEGVKIYDVQASADVLGSIKNFFGGLFPSP